LKNDRLIYELTPKLSPMNAFIQITSSGDQVSPHWTDVHRVDLVFEQSPTTWLQHLSRSLLVSFWS